jgi:hypothetical protein
MFQNNGASIFFQGKRVDFIKYQEVNRLPVNTTLSLVHKDSLNITGKLVYIDFPLFTTELWVKPYIEAVNLLADRGAIGVVTCQQNERRFPGYYYYSSNYGELKITAGFITKKSYEAFLSKGRTVNATFLSWDTNPYDIIYSSAGFVIYRILLGIMFFSNMALCCYKIIKWGLKKHKITFSIGLICLVVEFFTNLTRFILSIIYPSVNLYSIRGVDVTLTVPMCLSVITGILVIFFWFDLTMDPFFHKSGKCLGMMRIPAIITITLLILMEIALDITRNLIPADFITFLFVFYNVGIKLALALFYFVAAAKIIILSKTSVMKKKLKVITYRIVLSGVATIGAAACMMILSSKMANPPVPHVLDWFFLNFFWFLQSLFLISIFSPPGKDKKKSTASTTSSTPKIELSPNIQSAS